jgi:hypothetical protein
MSDLLNKLSAQQLARLQQMIDGGDETPDGATLHAEKNAPWVNGMYSAYRPPPYTPQFYPKWLFTADWLRADEQWRNALALRGRRGQNEDERERIIKDADEARAACMRLVQGPEEERGLGSLWHETPGKAVEAREAQARAIAEAAAISNWDDRRMGATAKAEREALDAASETHLTDVPRTPIKKSHHKKPIGRPRKVGRPVEPQLSPEVTP